MTATGGGGDGGSGGEAPLTTASGATVVSAVSAAQRATPSRKRAPCLSEDTRIVLLQKGAKGVAKRRGISMRTLIRDLKDGGESAASLTARIRRDEILALLHTEVPLCEVARRVGLSGTQALTRFCRRLLGDTPGRLRRESFREN